MDRENAPKTDDMNADDVKAEDVTTEDVSVEQAKPEKPVGKIRRAGRKKSGRKPLPLIHTHFVLGLLFTLPLAAAETLMVLAIQPGDLGDLLKYLASQQTLAILNFLPFLLLTVGFFFLFGDPFLSAAFVGGVGGILALVNRTMIEKRDEPLSPKDFGLIKEAGDAVHSYGMNLHRSSLYAIGLFVLAMIVLAVLFHGRRPLKNRLGNLLIALAGCAACVGIFVGCIFRVYSDRDFYNSLPVKTRYYIAGVYNQLGFPYCFCYNFTTYQVEKPEGFNAAEAAGYAAQHPTAEGGKDINVIMVMNEAFSDVTNHETFNYAPGDEPLKFYNSLVGSDQVISGYIVVPNYGAGTANTEFDVITGMQTNMISQNGASAFRVLHHDVDSIFRVFLADGYQTEFIHPGQDWFYNRQNVYRYFGAEKLLFSEAFEDAERKGSWVTDAAVLDVIEQEFEAAMAEGRPYFNYTTTIQNHMSYTADKYEGMKLSRLAELDRELAPGARTMLSVYAEGVQDSDEMLRNMTEYFEGREEPVLLVFFGDHLPNLGDSYFCYNELGMEIGEGKDIDTTLRTYKSPYIIWVNKAAQKELDFTNLKKTLGLPEDNVINANYLGALTLEITGRRDADSFFSYVNDFRRELPILHNGTGLTGDGQYFASLPETYAEEVRKFRFWEYYKLKVE